MILFVDATVRENSRTKRLARHLLTKLSGEVETVTLSREALPALTEELLYARENAAQSGDFSAEQFRLARQFAAADQIVIAAPYWDLSFPALLKRYLEQVCITGVTFRYSPRGIPEGLCRADTLYYVASAGGAIFAKSFGFGYVETLAKAMFGIPDCRFYAAEELDIDGRDCESILCACERAMDEDFAKKEG